VPTGSSDLVGIFYVQKKKKVKLRNKETNNKIKAGKRPVNSITKGNSCCHWFGLGNGAIVIPPCGPYRHMWVHIWLASWRAVFWVLPPIWSVGVDATPCAIGVEKTKGFETAPELA